MKITIGLPVVMRFGSFQFRALDKLALFGDVNPAFEQLLADFNLVPIDGNEEL